MTTEQRLSKLEQLQQEEKERQLRVEEEKEQELQQKNNEGFKDGVKNMASGIICWCLKACAFVFAMRIVALPVQEAIR